jgi:hypothetical protein
LKKKEEPTIPTLDVKEETQTEGIIEDKKDVENTEEKVIPKKRGRSSFKKK